MIRCDHTRRGFLDCIYNLKRIRLSIPVFNGQFRIFAICFSYIDKQESAIPGVFLSALWVCYSGIPYMAFILSFYRYFIFKTISMDVIKMFLVCRKMF